MPACLWYKAITCERHVPKTCHVCHVWKFSCHVHHIVNNWQGF